MKGVDSIREVLRGHTIDLYQLKNSFVIFDEIDAFVSPSRENETVEVLYLLPFIDPNAHGTHRYAIWEKFAEGIGNL